MTVEMAGLFPIIFFFLCAIICVAFYFQDHTKAQAIVDKMAVDQAVCIKEHRPLEETPTYEHVKDIGVFYYFENTNQQNALLEQKVKEKLNRSLFMSRVTQVETETSYLKITVKAKIESKLPVVVIREFLPDNTVSYTAYASVPVHAPAEFVRVYDQIHGYIENTSVYGNIVRRLREVKNADSR